MFDIWPWYIENGEPKWLLNGDVIENVSCIEILGVHYSVEQDDAHVRCRIEKCKRCFYGLSDAVT